MNTRQKGAKAEAEYAKELVDQGYLVERVKGSTKFNKSVDFFGIADLIALNPQGMLLVQVKSNSTDGALKQLKEWKQENENSLPQNLSLRVAVRIDGGGGKAPEWKIYAI